MPPPPPSPSKRKSIINGVVGVITGNNKNQIKNNNELKRNSVFSQTSNSSASSPSTLFSEAEEKGQELNKCIDGELEVESETEVNTDDYKPSNIELKTTTNSTDLPTVRLVSGTTLQSPIIIDEDSPKEMYTSDIDIPPGDYGRMPTKSSSSPTRSKSNNYNSSTRIIRSNAQKNLNNWSTTSLTLPTTTQQQSPPRSIDSVFDKQNTPNIAAAAAIASLEEEKARKLRDEIVQGSIELQQLQSILVQLPKLKRSSTRTTTDSSLFASSISNSSYSSNNPSGFIGGRSQSIVGTSQVITDLQSTIDILKCQLSEQEQIAKEEHDSKEALKRRCDIVESTLDSLRHQNGNLTQLLTRRERRITELEHDIECKAREISLLRQSETSSLSAQVDFQERILHLQEERDRLEAGYNTVLESSKRMKSKYQDEFSDIMSKVLVLQQQRKGDVSKILSLEVKLKDQSSDHDKLSMLQQEMSQLRQQHVGTIDKLFLDMKRTMSQSDHSVTTKVDSIQAVIDLVDNVASASKTSTTTTTTTTSSDEVIQVNIS